MDGRVLMPVSVAVMVGPGDIRVRRGSGLLTCVGLRSGACLTLYDPLSKVAGMAHVTHAWDNPGDPSVRPGKSADTVVEALLDAMERTGAQRTHVVAAIAGGVMADDLDPVLVDASVFLTLKKEVSRAGIALLGEDVAGDSDRGIVLDIAHGVLKVRLPEGDRLACDFNRVQRTNFTGRFTSLAPVSA